MRNVCRRITRTAAMVLVGWVAGSCDFDATETCIIQTGVSPTAPGAAREYNCDGFEERFLLAIPPGCDRGGCGLIADLPGATATAENPNLNTGLRQRTRDLPQPFLVLSANRPQLFADAASADRIFMFMQAVASVFSVDRDRVHIGGFSNGGGVTFNFICDPMKADFIASAAPQATSGNSGCFGTDPGDTNPPIPILYFSGRNDMIASFPQQRAAAQRILDGTGAQFDSIVQQSDIGGTLHVRFVGSAGQPIELVRYDNVKDPAAGPPALGGHCYVGPFTANGGACTGAAAFENGAKTLEFYLANPKRRP